MTGQSPAFLLLRWVLIVGLVTPVFARSAQDRVPCSDLSAACGGMSGADVSVDPGFGPPLALLRAAPSGFAPSERPQPQASPGAAASQGCASTDASRPSGLVVVLPAGKAMSEADHRAVNNPSINGVAAQVNWRDVEPVQGKPDWSRLDELFAAAEPAHKWIHLLIFPGFFSPAWALEGVETDLFPIQYGPGHGNLTPLPMPWDRVYLDRWFAFLKEVSDRYGKSPAFRLMAADGPTSVSAEMTLPVRPADLAKWRRHGYTARRYLDAWGRVFQTYADYFPGQCISLSGASLPILESGKVIDPAGHVRAIQEVVNQAQGVLGRRLAIQWSDLHAGRALLEAPDRTPILITYNGRLITGLQMRSAAEGGGAAVMGAEGDPPLALRRAVDKGLEPNNAGRRISYLEIYRNDVLAEEMQPVLKYAASLMGRQ